MLVTRPANTIHRGDTTTVAVKIRLKRLGKIRTPQYRIVVMDSRTKRDGRAIEEIGLYHPTEEPSRIEIQSERVQYWLGVGAQPTEQVRKLIEITGDWQKFKGLPGAEGTLKVAPEKADKKALYEAALKEIQDAPAAITPKAKKEEEKPAAEAKAEDKPAEEAKAEEAKAEEKPAEEAKADK